MSNAEKALEQFKITWPNVVQMCLLSSKDHYDIETEILTDNNNALFRARIVPTANQFTGETDKVYNFQMSMSYDEAIMFLEALRSDFIENHHIRYPGYYKDYQLIENDVFSVYIRMNQNKPIEKELAEKAEERIYKKLNGEGLK